MRRGQIGKQGREPASRKEAVSNQSGFPHSVATIPYSLAPWQEATVMNGQAKKDFEPEFSFVSSQKEYMHDTWNDIAKYCKKKARTNLDDKIAKIRKERKGDEAAPSDSGESSEEELSEDELVEDSVKVKQADLKRKMRKKATAAPDSGIDIQVS